jgi:hypothetical protein
MRNLVIVVPLLERLSLPAEAICGSRPARDSMDRSKLEVSQDPRPARPGGPFCYLSAAYRFVAKRSIIDKNIATTVDKGTRIVAR